MTLEHTQTIRNEMFSTPKEVENLQKDNCNLLVKSNHVCVLGGLVSVFLFQGTNICIKADMNLLVETVQGCEVTDIGTKYDNNWICFMAKTKLVNEQKVAISRTLNPLDFGATANAVRFVIRVMHGAVNGAP